MAFNDRQITWLGRPLDMRRVKVLQGNGYLEAWDVIAVMSRVFGFGGWDKEVTACECLYDENVTWTKDGQQKTGWDVAYRATVRITVRDPDGLFMKVSEDVATGQAQHQPHRGDAHDLAIKTAVSDAMKRAAKDLGDQFGLGLYNDGKGNSYITDVLAYQKAAEMPPAADPEEVGKQAAAIRDRMIGEGNEQ